MVLKKVKNIKKNNVIKPLPLRSNFTLSFLNLVLYFLAQHDPLPSLQWSLFLDKNNISQIIRDKSFHQWLSLNHDSYDNTSNLLWLYSLISNYLSQIT